MTGTEVTRDTDYLSTWITRDGRDGCPVEPGRYRLVAARACPWANRAIIVRRLLGLEDVISMGLCAPTHDERSWTFDLDPGAVDPVLGYHRLEAAYLATFPDYSRGITVPAMVEIATRKLVTNDYRRITLDFSTEWTDHHRPGAPDLYPEAMRGEIDELAEVIYTDVNDGVVLWAYTRDLFQTPGFGDTIDFVQIKQHYYIVHTDINPTQLVPRGPDLSGWLIPHGREQLGGRPFGDGTPPPPTATAERVPASHGAHATGAKQSMDTVSMDTGSQDLATSPNGEVHR